MPLQGTCLQRSHENLVLILIPLKPCLRVRDSGVIPPPSHSLRKAALSIPLHAGPALLAEPAALSHGTPLPAQAEPAAASRPKLPLRVRLHCEQQPLITPGTAAAGPVHTELLNACGLKEIIRSGARLGYRRPSASSLLCHTLPRMLVYFLETQSIITEMTPRLPDSRAGSEGQVAAL